MFIKDSDNNTLWVDSSEEDSLKFREELFNSTVTASRDNVEKVSKQLESFSTRFLEENSKVKNINISYLNTLNNIVMSGEFGKVDIILPVYGGLHVLKPCLKALEERTSYPYKIIIVDDNSPDFKTKEFLVSWQKNNPEHKVLFQPKNKGFAASVNKGIREGKNKYVCVLNSDVLVTPNWLSKLVLALEASPDHAIVNPATNNTAVIEIPMPPGLSYLDVNKKLEELSPKKYPEIMPTGFCFMFKRDLINKIGLFDEAYGSYGEETDFWMKALGYTAPDGTFPRLKAVLSDDTYLYHERGSSFSALGTDNHMKIRRAGSERFHRLWPQFKAWRRHNKIEDSIKYIKDSLSLNNQTESNCNVAFLVFSAAYCGGMAFITDIVNEMNEQGINAKVVQIKRDPSHDVSPPMGELRCAPISFDSPKEAIEFFNSKVFEQGLVIAATNEMQIIANEICKKNRFLTNLLFTQSYDPGLAHNEDLKDLMHQQYHSAPYILSNAKWLDEAIKAQTKRSTLGFVSPGVNLDLFYPRDRNRGDDRPTVVFFLNSKDPYRGFDRGMEVAFNLNQLSLQANKDIRLVGIGVDSVLGAPFITCLGSMPQPKLATFLGEEADIACDPQLLHSYGMPSLEAMASGVVPVCWDNVGINEFATNGKNAIILPREATPKMVAQEIFSLLFDSKLNKFKQEAIEAAKYHNRKLAVHTVIEVINKTFKLRTPKKRIFMVTPHLRKHGGPTTILHTAEMLQALGHDVTLGVIYPDLNPEIIKNTKIPISTNWKNPGNYDIIITNSDNPYNEHFSYAKWADKKIMFKLSHNPRFQKVEDDSLKLEWDAICTSSEWLRRACMEPLTEAGWTHPPRDAFRVGWYHYGHKDFVCKYTDRKYFLEGKMNICTLIHQHPFKGTPEALKALAQIKQIYADKVNIFAIGEWPEFTKHCPPWMRYYLNLDRQQMAQLFRQMDFFLSASKSEGLGRLPLEAMSASCLVIKTPTEAEFEKDMFNCIITKGNSPEDFVEALNRLGSNEEIFKQIVKEGFHTAERLSDFSEYQKNWSDILESLYA